MASNYESNPAVINLRNYLRIRSVHPNVNYDECIAYLRGQAQELGLPVQVYEPLPKKPVLVITWEGTDPTLPSVLLNSHMDVVPVFEKSWTHPPFEAHIKDGVIYGRGAQDMKSVSIQYLEAVKRLKAKGIRLKRTLHLSFVPDEEIGGQPGMGQFIKTEDFKKLNIGFALDEGIASPTEEYHIFNGERTIWHLKFICPGKSGHGSLLLPNNNGEKVRTNPTSMWKLSVSYNRTTISSWSAGGIIAGSHWMQAAEDRTVRGGPMSNSGWREADGRKIRYIIDKFMDLRAEAKKQLAENPDWNIGDVTTVNLTLLSGGIQDNVVPEELTATFDIRIALTVDQAQFEDTIKRWCAEAGEGVRYESLQKDPYTAPTKLDDTNPYWLGFKAAADQLKISLKRCTFPGGTDSRFIRELGIPAIGFSPINHTTPGLHEHDEHLNIDVFLRGIELYEGIIPAVANV